MKLSSRSASLLLGLTLIAPFAQPTAAVQQSAGKNQPAIKPNTTTGDSSATPQQRALVLLDQLLGQTKDFQGLTRSLKIAVLQSESANLLWDYDRPRARTLFENAVRSADAPRVHLEADYRSGRWACPRCARAYSASIWRRPSGGKPTFPTCDRASRTNWRVDMRICF